MLALSVPAAATGIAFVQRTGNNAGASPGSIAATLSGTVVGNLLTLTLGNYSNAAGCTVTSNNGTTFTSPTNGFLYDGSFNSAGLWFGKNAASGSVTVTVTGSLNYPNIVVDEWSGTAASGNDEGIGQKTNYSGGGTTSTITTNGNTTMANSLIISVQVPISVNPNSIGANQMWTVVGENRSYQLIDSLGSPVTHTYGYPSNNSAVVMLIVALK